MTASATTPRRSRVRCACIAIGVTCLAACDSLAPRYSRPPLPVAAQYAPQFGSTPQPGDTALPPWRGYFSSAPLQQLIAQALEQNRDLRVAVLRVRQARAAYGIEAASRLPLLGAQAAGQRQRLPADLSLSGREMITSQYQAGLGVSDWEPDFWGRLASLRGAALEQYLASDAARRAVTIALIAQVADGYFAVREMDQRIALTQRTLATRRESFRIVARREAVGATSRLNLTQVETLLIQAEALEVQLEQERDLKRHALELLVGAPLPLAAASDKASDTASDGAPGEQADSLPMLAAGLPSALLERRADIMAAEHALKAEYANIGAARAAFFPQLSLTATLGSASAQLGGLFAAGSGAWTFVPSLTLPLFDGGRRRDNLSLAQARRDSAIADYEKTIQAAFRDVADALSAQAWLARQVAIAERALQIQRVRARLAGMRHDSGAAPFLDVLDAERDLLSAEQQLVQLRRGFLSAGVALYAALGGDPAISGAGPMAGTQPLDPQRP